MKSYIGIDAQSELPPRDYGRRQHDGAANLLHLFCSRKRQHLPLHCLGNFHSLPATAVVVQSFPN